MFLTAISSYTCSTTEAEPLWQSDNYVSSQSNTTESIINSVCNKISKSDFIGARDIIRKSCTVNSTDIRHLETIIDEYLDIQTRRDTSRNNAYLEQKGEFDKLRQKGLPKDIYEAGTVLSNIVKIMEYSGKEQQQTLINDSFIEQTVEQAKEYATELELKAKWFDAYQQCYSKLMLIYKDNDMYCDYAEQLLEKVDIAASLQDNPCQTCQDRCEGIDEKMFINTVNFLDSNYVSIIDYNSMAIKGINRCKLLVEVISNPHIELKDKINNKRCKAFLSALTAISDELNRSQESADKDKLTDIFERILAINESRHEGMGLPPALLIMQFSKGALSSLDPYTVIYWPNQAEKLEKQLNNKFTGIGIRFSKETESPRILSVLPDTPAYQSGIEAGDIIEAVNGIAMNQMSAECVAESIAGPEGTQVTLTIRHEGQDDTIDITLRRSSIVIPSIQGWQRSETGQWQYMIDSHNKIGYIRISCFDSMTVEDFETILTQLENQGLNGLILDLRHNPGGLLNGAIEIADMFIEEGLIARIQPRFGMPTYLSANKENTHSDYPLVVLINGSTASSAEILSGILQEPKHNRAIIVGERSYGKSSVQSIVSHLGEGAKLKYTTAYYYLPSGEKIKNRCTNRKTTDEDWGVLPQVNLNLRSDEQLNITKMQRANESTAKDHMNNATSERRFTSQQTIDADPQLATGILVLKSKIIESGRKLY
ncbi:MAG: S41 family peptidase [Sedimentisphaerales bacterium]|nr:S41 family peptidase [Sedimentisphaerales bacterium]